MPVKKLISGGQTGVDRAALDVAIEVGILHGGFCPLGRRSEDGIIPLKYDLIEHDSIKYADRTQQNVDFSEGTLILHIGIISKGTALTKVHCIKKGKPLLVINLFCRSKSDYSNFNNWLRDNSINILNIAGPRESEGDIYKISKNMLRYLLCDK